MEEPNAILRAVYLGGSLSISPPLIIKRSDRTGGGSRGPNGDCDVDVDDGDHNRRLLLLCC